MSQARSETSSDVAWESYARWDRAEVLASRRLFSRLLQQLRTQGNGVTRHFLPASRRFALVHWRLGPDDYAALENRELFLRLWPGEAGLIALLDWRGLQVEFASAVLTRQALPPEGRASGAFVRRCANLLARLRERCSLGPGYLTTLGEPFLHGCERLSLYDRQAHLLNDLNHPQGRAAPASLELDRFDREFLARRHAI